MAILIWAIVRFSSIENVDPGYLMQPKLNAEISSPLRGTFRYNILTLNLSKDRNL